MASVLKKPLCKCKKILICNLSFDKITLFINWYLLLILFSNKLFHIFLLNKGLYVPIVDSSTRANRRESLAPEPCQKIRCELRKLGALATSSPFEARKLRDYGLEAVSRPLKPMNSRRWAALTKFENWARYEYLAINH